MYDFNKQMESECQKIFGERKIVFGSGKINAEIMLIGEAPGGEEEKQGKPFVGKAGKNLNEFLEI
ncbi:MAG: uracil-DNA glycosylase family protein, partial [Clostridia bacterium]|nr:uracil-DNA glycosylase family protein [Clostridia bacterium]